ncbi:MAG TPA: transposase [Lacunisphaera sp.]|nr:transposase [Lacunisphaera sp.]
MGHIPPSWVGQGAVFFVTICCEERARNQLCHPATAERLFEAARHYHKKQDWFVRQMLLMPDHLHALIAPAPDKVLSRLIGDWKRYTATGAGIRWQKNFFEHRLRGDEGWEQKTAYIKANPVRAGLCGENEPWPFQIEY